MSTVSFYTAQLYTLFSMPTSPSRFSRIELTSPARILWQPHLIWQFVFGGFMPLDLLAIAAHPDDVELTCGGTVLKMSQAGYRTGILDLTRGETGTRGTPQARLREAERAGKILGVKVRRNLGLPDARLFACDEYKVAVAETIRELKPHTIVLPYWD